MTAPEATDPTPGVRTNGDVWTDHGHPGVPCSPPEAVHGEAKCRNLTDSTPGAVGRCGDRAPGVMPGARSQVVCRLSHGHAGWHKGDDGSEWTHGDPTPGEVCPSRCGRNDPCPDPWHDRPTPGEVRLSDVEALADVLFRIQHGRLLSDQFDFGPDHTRFRNRARGLLDSDWLAARLAEVERLRRERDAAEHLLRQSMDRASAAEAEVADLRAAWGRLMSDRTRRLMAQEYLIDRGDYHGQDLTRHAQAMLAALRAALGGEHA